VVLWWRLLPTVPPRRVTQAPAGWLAMWAMWATQANQTWKQAHGQQDRGRIVNARSVNDTWCCRAVFFAHWRVT
jgi:hypothetical protein